LIPSKRYGGLEVQRGFTLVEVMMWCVIAALVSSGFFTVWTFTQRFTQRGRSDVEAQQMARIVVETITNDLREALAVPEAFALWSPADGAPLDAIGLVSARREVQTRLFNLTEHGDAAWQTAVYYVHDRDREILRRATHDWQGSLVRPGLNEGRVVARGVKSVRFGRRANLITVEFSLRAATHDVSIITSIAPRN
jgi:hypothetical protein